MRRSEAAARAAAVVAAACLWLLTPACADAAITSVFNQTASPVPCRVLGNGVRLCDETAFVPPRPRSTVKTFDGVPTDVRVAFPAQPGSGLDGAYPLMMRLPGYSGKKTTLQS